MAAIDTTTLLRKAIKEGLQSNDISGLVNDIANGFDQELPNPLNAFAGRIQNVIDFLQNQIQNIDNYQWGQVTQQSKETLIEIARIRAKIIIAISQAFLLVQTISDKLQQFTDEEAFAFVTINGQNLEIYTGPIKELLQDPEFLTTLSVNRYATSRGGALKLSFSQSSLSKGTLNALQLNKTPRISNIQKQVKRHITARSFVLEGYARSAILGTRYRFRQDNNPFYGTADIQGQNLAGEFVRYSVKSFKNYNINKELENISSSLTDISTILSQLKIYQALATVTSFKLNSNQLNTLVSNQSEEIKMRIIKELETQVSK